MARKHFDAPISPNGIEHFGGGPLDGVVYIPPERPSAHNHEDIPTMRIYGSHKYVLSVRDCFLVYEYAGTATAGDMLGGDPVSGVGWLWDKAYREKAERAASSCFDFGYSLQNIPGFPYKQLPDEESVCHLFVPSPCNHIDLRLVVGTDKDFAWEVDAGAETTQDYDRFSWTTLIVGLAMLGAAIALLYADLLVGT